MWNNSSCFNTGKSICKFVRIEEDNAVLKVAESLEKNIGEEFKLPLLKANECKISLVEATKFITEFIKLKKVYEIELDALSKQDQEYFKTNKIINPNYKNFCWRVSNLENLKNAETLLIHDNSKHVAIPVNINIAKNEIEVLFLASNTRCWKHKHEFFKLKK
jgi:hypothetical protein